MLILGASHDSSLSKFEEIKKRTSKHKAKHRVPILGLSYPCSHDMSWHVSIGRPLKLWSSKKHCMAEETAKKHWKFQQITRKEYSTRNIYYIVGISRYIITICSYIPICSKLSPKNRSTYNIVTGMRYTLGCVPTRRATWKTDCAYKAKYLSMIVHVMLFAKLFNLWLCVFFLGGWDGGVAKLFNGTLLVRNIRPKDSWVMHAFAIIYTSLSLWHPELEKIWYGYIYIYMDRVFLFEL